MLSKRQFWLLWGVQLSGMLSTYLHPLMPLFLIGAASAFVLLLYFNQILVLLLAHVGIFKGIVLESIPALQGIDITVLLSLLCLLVIIWRSSQPATRQVFRTNRAIIIAYFVWVAWMIIASSYAPNSDWALYKSLRFAFFNTVLFLTPLTLINSRRDSRTMLYLFLLSGVLGVLSIALRALIWLQTTASVMISVRLSILGSDPIGTARVLVICAAMCAVLMLTGKEKSIKWVALMVIYIIAAMVTGSRGPLVALVAGVGLTGLLLGGKARINTLWLLLFLALIGGAVLALAPEGMVARLKIFSGGELARTERGVIIFSTAMHRLQMWKIALNSWLSDPVHLFFGVGTAGYANLFPWRNVAYPHNLPLEVLAEFGLLGASIFSFHIYLALRRIWARIRSGMNREELMWLIGLLTYLFATMVSGDLNSNRLLWFLFSGMLATITVQPDVRTEGE